MSGSVPLELLPSATVLLRPDGAVAAFNEVASALLGPELASRPLVASFADGQRVAADLARAAEGEVRGRHLLVGRERWVDLTLRPGPEGSIVAFAHDVTDELGSDRRARWLALALDSCRTIAWELDLRTGRAVREGPLASVLGSTVGEGGDLREVLERMLPADRALWKSQMDRLAREGGSAQHQFAWGTDGEGHPRWLHVSARAIADDAGAPARIVGVAVDVSSAHADSQRAADLQARYEAVVQSAHEGILAIDAQQRIVLANPAAAALFGYTVAELAGAPLSMLLPPSHRTEHADHVRAFAASGELRRRHLTQQVGGLRRDGTVLPLDASIARTTTASGDLMTVVVRDARDKAALAGELVRSDARFANAFRMSPTPTCIVGADDHVVLDVNAAFRALVGREAHELVGLPLDATQMLSAAEDVVALLDGARSARIVGGASAGVITPTGEKRSCRLSAYAVDSPDGPIWLASWTDETELRALEDARRLADDTLVKTFRVAPCGIAIVRTSDRVVVEANDALLEIAGVTSAELMGKTLGGAGLALRRPVDVWERLAREGRVRDEPVELIRRDGALRSIRASAESIEVGGVPHALIVWNDETERLRAEAAERDATERLTDFANAIHEVFWLIDLATGTPLYVSPAYERVWGRPVAEVFTRPESWLEAIHPDDRERVEARTGRSHTKDHSEIEYRIVRPDGAVRWIRDVSFPVRNAKGEVTRKAGVCEDTTESRRVRDQLHEAQKMESMGRLAGGVAHDFNNILTVVAACSDVLAEAIPEGSEAGDIVDELRLAGERAASLTRQLLAFSRREVVEPRVLDPLGVVRDTNNMLRRVLGEDISLRPHLALRTARVRIDPGQLVQVLMNLAVNARDAMPEGGTLAIEVADEVVSGPKCAPDAPAGAYVRISVRDDGVGMPPEVRERVFEPFFTTKAVGRGTGLGLSVVHGIVRQANGFLCVESEPGVGSTFHVYLPSVRDAAEGVRATAQSTDGHGERILLVEDDDSVRRLAANALASHGYEVLQAGNGARGLELLRQSKVPIELVLTDVVMPELDGRRLVEAALAELPRLKVLYTSGYTDDEIVRHGVEQASVGFLPKPYSVATLLHKVREVLGPPTSA